MIGGGVYNQSGGSNFFRAFERCVGLDCGEETPGQVDTPIHMNRPDRGEFFMTPFFECKKATEDFSNKLAIIYNKHFPSEKKHEDIQKEIFKWLEEGIESEIINKLLSPPSSNKDIPKNFPIWWSGFWIEAPPEINPSNDMKEAANNINGWSSLDTLMSDEAFDEQNAFWSKCSYYAKDNKEPFKWGEYVSIAYTKLALQNNPDNIGLFVNKNVDDFLKSDFFKFEVDLINEHYKKEGKVVNLHIMNKIDNCKEIIEKLAEKTTNIHFKINEESLCISCCDSLNECSNDVKKWLF